MADVTRKIGLSLGADVCWPIAFTEIMNRLDLSVPHGDDNVRIEVERMTIEPFDLEEHASYDVVIDRLTHWYNVRREWIKKAVLLDDVYVFNNPWSVQSMEKLTSYAAMIRLGFPIPKTWLLPPKSYDMDEKDLDFTLRAYARYFDLEKIGASVGYPLFMKPYDGGGWRAVSKVDDADQLKAAYEESGSAVMHLQAAVTPFDRFVRCVGLGPQTRVILYDIEAPLHNRYTLERDFATEDELSLIRDMTLVINAFFAWDFNSCELIHKDGVWHPIDFANPCPDSQVTSPALSLPLVDPGQPTLVDLRSGDEASDAPHGLASLLLLGRGRDDPSRAPGRAHADRPPPLRNRTIRRILRGSPGRTCLRWRGASSPLPMRRTRCAKR